MNIGTYGLGTAARPAASRGLGLAGAAQDQQQLASQALAGAAGQETQNEIAGKEQEVARKAGNAQLGSTAGALAGAALGAQYGSVGGPWGMAIGALVGGLASRFF